ncbi:hypothetical protein NEOKW01_0427 [Nematocida sp. AWRm80]|nr:hypothetical protein NEOKW01_0427 [Nematocida sp. AWRm80]
MTTPSNLTEVISNNTLSNILDNPSIYLEYYPCKLLISNICNLIVGLLTMHVHSVFNWDTLLYSSAKRIFYYIICILGLSISFLSILLNMLPDIPGITMKIIYASYNIL